MKSNVGNQFCVKRKKNLAEMPFARGSVSDLNTLYAQLRRF